MRNQNRYPLSILIVSDSHILRSGLQKILESATGIRVLGDVNFEKARTYETPLRQHPDLILFDLDPRSNKSFEVLAILQETLKNTAVLVLSELADYELTYKALALGAAAVVLKIQPPAVLIAAVKEFSPRYCYESIPKEQAMHAKEKKGERLVNAPALVPGTRAPNIDSLTAREREVIRLVALGLKNKDIANRLSISDITVRHHLTSIFCKLEVADRQNLLILAHRYGLADLTLQTESA